MTYIHLNEPLKALAYSGTTTVWAKRHETQNDFCTIKHTVHHLALTVLKTDPLKSFKLWI